jgi:glutaredoxin
MIRSDMKRRSHLFWGVLVLPFLICRGTVVWAQPIEIIPSAGKVRCVAIEIYSRSSDSRIHDQARTILELANGRRGVRAKIHDLDQGPAVQDRLDKITKAFQIASPELPIVYGMNQTAGGSRDEQQWERHLDRCLTMEVFVRQGCSRCAQAKEYLIQFQAKYPGIRIELRDVSQQGASNRFNELLIQQKIGGISFPGFWFCKRLIVGFDQATATSARFDQALLRWTFDCQVPMAKASGRARPTRQPSPSLWPPWSLVSYVPGNETGSPARQESPPPGSDATPPASPPDLDIDPLPIEEGMPAAEQSDSIEVPWLGQLSASKLGLPVFTILIGLADGFNPCAMWVLLFLLSILVNLSDRPKMLAIAGTFVFVSGAAYFAFMAAWLNVLLLVGFLRWVQILLATLAIFVGIVHIKDFLAFKKGISLSIPESAKPGIYRRVRSIVMAEHWTGAIAGAFILAVLVNVIELLCTAGLPAMYSQVLTMQQFPFWKNYAYLFLYILAYMFDDSLMVAIVVITLGRRKLQETEGRWLKLASGLVVLGLGLVLLFKPDWLG